MSKKFSKEINKILNMPGYADKEEFLDKFCSYLFVRYKFNDLKFINKEELIMESSLFANNNLIIRLKDNSLLDNKLENDFDINEIKAVYAQLEYQQMPPYFIQLKIGSTFFKKFKDLKLFINFLAKYISQTIEIFTLIENNKQLVFANELEKDKNKTKISKLKPTSIPNTFYSIDAKNIPDSIQMEKVLSKIEKEILSEMLHRADGIKTVAAKHLGITERIMGYKIKKYNLK